MREVEIYVVVFFLNLDFRNYQQYETAKYQCNNRRFLIEKPGVTNGEDEWGLSYLMYLKQQVIESVYKM